MKKINKSILKIIAAIMFAMMLLFSVTNSDYSLLGIQALASGSTSTTCFDLKCPESGPYEGQCQTSPEENCVLNNASQFTIWKQPNNNCNHTFDCSADGGTGN